MIDELRDETVLYNVLRRVFLQEPTEDFLTLLQNLPVDVNENSTDDGFALMVDDVRNHGRALSQYAEELSLEFVRLFLGPVRTLVVPFASFYLSETKQLMTDETIDVRKRYLDAGMAVRELHSIPDDHIGIELEFLFYLTGKILSLHESGMDGESSRYYEMRESFLREHCRLWFPAIADSIINNTESEFFRGAALLLKDCIEGAQHV